MNKMDIKEKISSYVKEHWEEIGIDPSVLHDEETLFIDASEFMKKSGSVVTISDRKYGWLMVKPKKEVVKDDKVAGFPYRMGIEVFADPNATGKTRFAIIWFGEESGFNGEVQVISQNA